MVHVISFLLALVGLSPFARAQYGYDGGGDPGSPTSNPVPNPSANNPSPVGKTGVGDVQCSPDMCIGAAVKGNNVEYVMQSTGAQQLGWMAMGFGTSMVDSPLVIMWANPDRTYSLSQRRTKQRSLPSVDPTPPRRATVSVDLSSWIDNQPKFAFTIPIDADMQPKVIWALGTDVPTSAIPEQATFRQHLSHGSLTLDLNKQNTSVSLLESPALALDGKNDSGGAKPQSMSRRDMVVLAHGVVCAVAYLVIMPAGAILARYYRTLSPAWFKGHWIVQFAIGFPIVIVGAVLSSLIPRVGGPRTWGTHSQVGVLLFVLYGMQCLLGGVIHFVKPAKATRRPAQNYMHAILGITIIAVAFYQVRTGYKTEWLNATSHMAPPAIDVMWYLWIVCVPLAYFGGLVFLKKQYMQEGQARHRAAQERAKMTGWGEGKFNRV